MINKIKKAVNFLLVILCLSFLSCEKDIIHLTMFSFKLDGKTYRFKLGSIENSRDRFEYIRLLGTNKEFNQGIRIDFKEKNSTLYNMSVDTIAVFISTRENCYISSNWPEGRMISKFGKSFKMKITYQDKEKIKGEFSGVLYSYGTENYEGTYKEVELKDGKFNIPISESDIE
jgi:hypothetical protein